MRLKHPLEPLQPVAHDPAEVTGSPVWGLLGGLLQTAQSHEEHHPTRRGALGSGPGAAGCVRCTLRRSVLRRTVK